MSKKGRSKKSKGAGAVRKAEAKPSPAEKAPVPQDTESTGAGGASQDDQASKRFVDDLAVRGEAAPLDEEGNLPLQATHVIKKKPDGTVEVKRARFKMF
jgi:hypothetical protein